VLQLLHPDGALDDARLAELIKAYKTHFHQQSVLKVSSKVSAEF
jgi:hypothetical protein